MRRQFGQYFITGISGAVLDFGSLYVFKEKFNLHPVTAVVINQILCLTYIFLLNKFWTFKATGQTREQLIRFAQVYVFNYTVAIGWMWVAYSHWHWNYLLARFANIAVAVMWNFLLYKYWVYHSGESTVSPAGESLG